MTVTIELSQEREAALKAQAEAHGLSIEQWLIKLAEQQAGRDAESQPLAPADHRPISQVIAEIMRDVPAEAFASLPTDGASQVDHYLCGHPKR